MKVFHFGVGIDSLAKAKEHRLDTIRLECEKKLSALQASYSSLEVLSWERQLAEANDVLANGITSRCRLLTKISGKRGISLSVLALRVVSKAEAFADASGDIIGTRQLLEDRVDAATTLEELAEIRWPADLTVEN